MRPLAKECDANVAVQKLLVLPRHFLLLQSSQGGRLVMVMRWHMASWGSSLIFIPSPHKKKHNNLASRITIKFLLWRVVDLDRNDDWLNRTRIKEKELKFIELCSIKKLTLFRLLSHWQLWQEVADEFGNFSCCDVGQILLLIMPFQWSGYIDIVLLYLHCWNIDALNKVDSMKYRIKKQ